VQSDGEESMMDGRRRKRWWGGGEGWGKVCFLSKAKETLIVNLAPKQTNMIPIQTTLLCIVSPSPLPVHKILEFPQ